MKVKRKWAALLGAVVMAASCAMLSDGNVVKAASKPVVSSSAANAINYIFSMCNHYDCSTCLIFK